MLNSSYPRSAKSFIRAPYLASSEIARRSTEGNEAFDTGREYRLQSVYGDEIWLKLGRAGLDPSALSARSVLEVCAGTGFLTYHLLSRCRPGCLTVNDISEHELEASKRLIGEHCPDASVEWVLGDMHELSFRRTFDVILGNSFMHHFHDVPRVLSRFASLLGRGGLFVSLHEPTLLAPVVEGAKTLAYPLAVLAPGLVVDIARKRFKGEPSATDIWLFEAAKLKRVALESGFSGAEVIPWHFVRPIVVQKRGMHLSADKPKLSLEEQMMLERAIRWDSWLNRILPSRFFGSICLVCRK